MEPELYFVFVSTFKSVSTISPKLQLHLWSIPWVLSLTLPLYVVLSVLSTSEPFENRR